ncbi:ABC transporter ATP-binding protein [Demequina oxidasica]|uniref:ABC transporter ATP-binding protein n=1 Tax=Demequina oxidasica TaxID=676199 RepID=UPI0007840DFF|nr:ATP-binding cassette domain-containing protein [Demequina oxidasica]
MPLNHHGVDDSVLRAEDVSFFRGSRTILDSVDLTVHRGERWALIGPNGAGKSTLISLLAAVSHPSRGSVSVLGYRLGRVDMRELRSHIGLVVARHPLSRDLPARDVVLTGVTGSIELIPRWEPTPAQQVRADELLNLVGITQARVLRWATMSQGERGRVLIARALMNDPALLLLDEATTGLDVAAREQLLATLSDLAATHPHMATVTVTHHFEELPASTTHAALLREGCLLVQGDVETVLTTDNVSRCFDHPIQVSRSGGRWTARST